LEAIATILPQAQFQDGKLTADWYAKLVKQPIPGKTAGKGQIVEAPLDRNPLFQAAVRPKIVRSLIFSRYYAGMSYGRHADNALMGSKNGDRTFPSPSFSTRRTSAMAANSLLKARTAKKPTS